MKDTGNMVLFWGSWPSQWHPSIFVGEDFAIYNCTEQYMMAGKARLFNDAEALEAIMNTTDPKVQKALGREVANFDPDVWNAACRDIVRRGNLFKFTQNPDLLSLLLATGDKLIVEASPYDKIWGIGLGEDDPRALDQSQWRGTNWLGEDVMFVRKLLTDAMKQR